MHELEFRLAAIREREAHLRSIRVAERHGREAARTLRTHLGESLIRLGRRVAGEQPAHPTTPAWTG